MARAKEEVERWKLEDLEAALAAEPEVLRRFLARVHPADLARLLYGLDDADARAILGVLDVEERAELLRFAEEDVREELLALLEPRQIADVVDEMPADEAVDLLALADDAKTEAVLARVDLERAADLRALARYPSESAGGLMTTEFIAVPADARVGDAIKGIRSEEGPVAEEELGVFVVDSEGRPLGFVSDRELLTTPIHTPVAEVMDDDLIVVHAEDDQEEVAQLVARYDAPAVPVIDDSGRMIGVISAEDAQEVYSEEAEEDIRKLVGTSPGEQTRLPVLARVRHRFPLQALTVAGGLVTAAILRETFPSTGQGAGPSLHALRYLPIIIALAGNVGIQSSTILVRAFATGEAALDDKGAVLRSELLVGLVIGIACGLLTAGFVGLIEGRDVAALHFGGSIGTAIAVAVTWASFLGCAVPMACDRLGIDPAVVAGPFLITLSDVSGTTVFVLVAHLLLGIHG